MIDQFAIALSLALPAQSHPLQRSSTAKEEAQRQSHQETYDAQDEEQRKTKKEYWRPGKGRRARE